MAVHGNPEVAELAGAELSPGRGLRVLRRDDIDTAMTGSRHHHAVIRRHATTLLRTSRFCDRRVTSALRAGLDDATVRRVVRL